LLLLVYHVLNPTIDPMLVGMDPVNLLTLTVNVQMFVRDPTVLGRLPVNLFVWKYASIKFDNEPIEAGIVLLNELVSN
jgi:hypothetical protein